jgi:hypothetical protein
VSPSQVFESSNPIDNNIPCHRGREGVSRKANICNNKIDGTNVNTALITNNTPDLKIADF